MPNNGTTLDVVLQFLTTGEKEALEAIRLLEQEGVKFNEKAGRFTIAGQFAGKEDVKKIYQDVLKGQSGVTAEAKKTYEVHEADRMSLAEAQKMLEQGRENPQPINSIDIIGNDLADAKVEADLASKSVQNIDKNLQSAGRSARSLGTGMAGFMIAMTGSQITSLGKSLLSPVNQYVEYAGQASASSREWLEIMRELSKSGVRIGAVMAETVLPILRTAADVAEKISAAFEKNPDLAKAAAVLGLGAIGVGGVLQVGGNILSGLAAFKTLGFLTGGTAAAGAAGAAGGAALSASGIVAFVTPLIPIIITATLANLALRNIKLPGQNESIMDSGTTAGKRFIAIAAAGFSTLIGGSEAGDRTFIKMAKSLGILEDSADKASAAITDIPQAALDAFIGYRQQEVEAEQQYGKQRTSIVEETAKQLAESEQKYAAERKKYVDDFNQQQAEASADRERSVAKAYGEYAVSENRYVEDQLNRRSEIVRDAQDEVVRIEEQHQKRIRDMLLQHNDKVADLIDARDALGLYRENRDFAREKQQAEEETNAQIAQRRDDLAKRLADQDEEFRVQAQRRAEDFQRRMAQEAQEYAIRQARDLAQFQTRIQQMDADNKAEIEKLRADSTEKLRELDQTYNEERRKRRAAFNDQLRDLDAALLNETNLMSQWYNKQSQLFQQAINSVDAQLTNKSGYAPERRASGGYASYGMYWLGDRPGRGEDEWVANAQTTQAMERMVGGRLTQSSVVNRMMAGSASSVGNVTIAPQIIIQGGLFDHNTEQRVYSIARKATVEGFKEAFNG